uniref:Secreted protein n=1 Tax=Prorocentrum micans TaxID=2945 RepID=A0A7S2X461_PROMC|mmetsp:Transcript_11530/g.9111  ORF Transcript_11530/g.9111 Transcript_11530/m.9111 type:complete len:147 (+) Transcript_11530:12-452(+)
MATDPLRNGMTVFFFFFFFFFGDHGQQQQRQPDHAHWRFSLGDLVGQHTEPHGQDRGEQQDVVEPEPLGVIDSEFHVADHLHAHRLVPRLHGQWDSLVADAEARPEVAGRGGECQLGDALARLLHGRPCLRGELRQCHSSRGSARL